MLALLLAACDGDAPSAGAPVAGATDAAAARPNVLVLDVDSLRHDLVLETPTFAALARQGTHFVNARSTAGWTLPGFLSLGYHNAYAWGSTLLAGHPDSASWFGPGAVPLHDTAEAAAALSTLAEPFFVLLHDVDVHPASATTDLGKGQGAPATEEEKAAFRADYLANVRAAEQKVATVLAALDASGRADRTLVVLLSDHGDSFGEGGGALGHGVNLRDEVLRIPLVLRGPGVPARRTVGEPVSIADVAPTVLAAAGIPVHEEMTGLPLQPTLASPPVALPPRVFYARTGEHARARIEGKLKLLVMPQCAGEPGEDPRRRMCARLFDLEADPGETTDIQDDAPVRTATFTSDLEAWVERQGHEAAMETGREFERALREHGYFDSDRSPAPR
jgi:arylsulfatase A-like enzyme